MFEERKLRRIEQAEVLLKKCGLKAPVGVDYTVGVFMASEGRMVATGSLKGDMIQGLAVDPEVQGEDLSAKVLTHLINYAIDQGRHTLYLFTKPESAQKLSAVGFRIIAEARPFASLLEWGTTGIDQYVEGLRKLAAEDPGEAAAVVVNCNPFTLGHQYLIETAASRSRKVYVIVVEEDQSVFPFADRIELVRKGTAHLGNVVVIPGGRYVVSSLTFPSYFTRDSELAAAHSAMDVTLFVKYIAPALGITKRFVGTEPYSEVTEAYNQAMKAILIPAGVELEVIERKQLMKGEEAHAISASRVRRYIAEGRMEELEDHVPPSTFEYLMSIRAFDVIKKLRSSAHSEKGYMEDGYLEDDGDGK
jgi:[citrate (pro-3S)-lyase] ligase